MRAWSPAASARAKGMRLTACQAVAQQLVGAILDRASWCSVSAGPPEGGLYLKPPSSGGLCDGVITTPSASPAVAPAVVARGSRAR